MGGAPPLKVGGSYPRYRNFLKEGFAPGTLFGAALPGPCSARPAGATYMCLNRGRRAVRLAIGDASLTPKHRCSRTCRTPERRWRNLDPIRYDEDGDGDFLDHYLRQAVSRTGTSTFGSNLSLGRSWRFNALFEYRGGNFTITNLTDAFRTAHPTIGTNTQAAADVEAIIRNPASTAQQRLDAAKIWWNELKALTPVRRPEPAGRWFVPPACVRSVSPGRRPPVWPPSWAPGTRPSAHRPQPVPEDELPGRGSRDECDRVATPAGGTDGNYLEAVDAFGWPIARRIAFAIRLGY